MTSTIAKMRTRHTNDKIEKAKEIIELLDGYYLNKIVFNYESLRKTMMDYDMSYCILGVHGSTLKSTCSEDPRMQLENERKYIKLDILTICSITEYIIQYEDEEKTKCTVVHRECAIMPSL